MSVQGEIERLESAKADIKSAIENKGITVGSVTLDGYAAKVNEIPRIYISTVAPTMSDGSDGDLWVIYE